MKNLQEVVFGRISVYFAIKVSKTIWLNPKNVGNFLCKNRINRTNPTRTHRAWVDGIPRTFEK